MCRNPLNPMPQPLKDFIESNFEANFLDGDKVNDCGGATFSAHGALDIAEHFYELGQATTLAMVMREIDTELERLKLILQPLEEEYDKEYKYWMRGIKSESGKKLLEEYESGAKGHKMFAISVKIDVLSTLKQKLSGNGE